MKTVDCEFWKKKTERNDDKAGRVKTRKSTRTMRDSTGWWSNGTVVPHEDSRPDARGSSTSYELMRNLWMGESSEARLKGQLLSAGSCDVQSEESPFVHLPCIIGFGI